MTRNKAAGSAGEFGKEIKKSGRGKDLLQEIIDAAKNSHLVFLDRDFNFVRVNETYARTCGFAPEEMIGRNHFDLFPGEENEAIFIHVRDSGIPAEFHDKPFIFPNQPVRGTTYWDWTLTPVKDNSDKVEGLVFSLFETTYRKRAEEALRKSEQLYRAIGESIDFGIWICDPEGRNIYASESFLKLVGITQEQCSNFGWGSVLHPDDAERTIAAWKECVRTGGFWDIEHRFRGTDGQWYPILARGVPVRDEQGALQYWAGINLDIRQIKKSEQALRESGERYRLALDAARMATWDWNVATGEIIWNETHYTMMGYKPGEVQPSYQAWAGRIHPDDIGAAESRIKQCMAERRLYISEFRTVWPDGTIRWLEARGDFEYDSKRQPLRCYGVMLDITERKQAEEQIKALNEQLRRQVAELDAANKELDAFSYSVSHDLRAPLRHISGFIKILMEDYAEQLDAQGRDYLKRVYAGSEKISRLIEDLLYLSHISRQELDRIEFNVSMKASSIIEGLHAASPNRQVEVSIQVGLIAFADPRLIEVAIANLLENAWKFTSKTDNARIEFSAFEQDGKTVYCVRDNGSGFDPQYKEKLFHTFHRLHSGKEFEGTGIGLSIVDRIVQRHGGSIWAEGETGKGAAFFFTLN